MLEVLDLGNNYIHDSFPNWLQTLPKLQVLVLRSNRLHGSIDNLIVISPFCSLRIIDLSHNEFTGLLQIFKLWRKWMKLKLHPSICGGLYYQDSVVLTMKGTEVPMERILQPLTYQAINLKDRFQRKSDFLVHS
jgi:hypothetical protein